MSGSKLLIANRGEIAIRIAQAAAELGIRTVSIYANDDAASLHCFKTDESVCLDAAGVSAYLDANSVLGAAKRLGCDLLHPGYGFLAENAAFAQACEQAGVTFVGPPASVLDLFANKARARMLAEECDVPILEGSKDAVSLEEARAFFATLGAGAAMVIKAVSGGGGRGMRIVKRSRDVADSYADCRAEAQLAFGDPAVMVERFLPKARHIEVQIAADASGDIVHLGERDCTLQRRNQKLIECAPSPFVSPKLRDHLTGAAVTLARKAGYRNVGTFEFLLDVAQLHCNPDEAEFAFLECNPRIQVEHTVTEEVMSVDLVQAQLRIAAGGTLADMGFSQKRFVTANGAALQARINAELTAENGEARPSAGVIQTYELPAGRGVRVDGCGYAGYSPNPRYDSLLAKVVVHTQGGFPDALAKAARALRECRIEGVDTNRDLLIALLGRDEVVTGNDYTRFVDEHLKQLLSAATQTPLFAPADSSTRDGTEDNPAIVDADISDGSWVVGAPMQGMVSDLKASTGDAVAEGQALATIEAMKMVYSVVAPVSGFVRKVGAGVGQVVRLNQPMFVVEASADAELAAESSDAAVDLDVIRPDLAQILELRRLGQDDARPEAVAKRRKTGQRTARENVDDLCDAGSFVEYGALALASQSRRRSREDLAKNTSGDGIIAGIGCVNGAAFGDEASRCAVLAYDYMVLAGTQGHQTHRKKDRLLELAERRRLPVVLFSEGGGGRPGDVDVLSVTGMEVASFQLLAKLSGLVPLVGVNSGRCFAGNAALLGCCDVIIATENSTIGMGGPAMVEGGGLGVYTPDEIGPMSVQVPNGVVDIAVKDEAEAVAVAKKYISYFQGRLLRWTAPDQRRLRRLVPEDRVRAYDIRAVIECLADEDSVLELRRHYGYGIVTSLVRIEGRPVGLIANNPLHLGGAIDGPGADKASRFMQLCDAHEIPLLSLCDTPGFMVGPESEKTAVVRRFARMFVTAASVTTPMMAIVLRKAYGLGAMSMLAGQSRSLDFMVSWPSGEFGGMGLEGAIKLGLRKELEAIADPKERERYFKECVAQAYEFGKAANAAAHFELDDVIDPAESRAWIVKTLRNCSQPAPRRGKKRNHIDTW
ncbi:MAG: hypothetical protein RIR33_425 [Pseudomonadota bacterium]|jgi:acetyl/propionyl-CoA carboxylase alpha subunit